MLLIFNCIVGYVWDCRDIGWNELVSFELMRKNWKSDKD